jgi:Domain of unknown function (DUF1883)
MVEVVLDGAANVLLLDPTNFVAYKQRQPYHYYGGHATHSPFRLRAPLAGKWHVVIDLGGGPGSVRANVRVISESAVA